VMLAKVGLVIAQKVKPSNQFQVPIQRQGQIFSDPVERCHEYAKLHPIISHYSVIWPGSPLPD
jgi:hypothetical protein